jgi:hypothetical protein
MVSRVKAVTHKTQDPVDSNGPTYLGARRGVCCEWLRDVEARSEAVTDVERIVWSRTQLAGIRVS